MFKGKKNSSSGSPSPKDLAIGGIPDSRRLESFKFPSKYVKMEDHLARAEHENGPFEYVSISTRDKTPYKILLERLSSSKPAMKFHEVSIDDIPPIALSERTNVLGLKGSLPQEFLKNGKYNYVNIYEVIIFFTPMQSFHSDFSTVKWAILDERMVEEVEVRTLLTPSNVGCHGFMSLDYAVHKNDIQDIKLSISLSNSPLKPGKVWGSVKILVKARFSDIGMVLPVRKTTGNLRMPDTAFKKYKRDPNHADLTFDSEDLGTMTKFAGKGRIMDLTLPTSGQTRIAIAASEAGSLEAEREEESGKRLSSFWLDNARSKEQPDIPLGVEGHAGVIEEEEEEEASSGEVSVGVKDTTNVFRSSEVAHEAIQPPISEKSTTRNILSRPDESSSPETRRNTEANKTEVVKTVMFRDMMDDGE